MARDPAFKQTLLTEGINALLEGGVDTGKAVLRDYINATVWRMFGPGGNPTASNLFALIGCLQSASGVTLEVRAA